MKIIAFAGSNSSVSINKKLVIHTASYFNSHDVEIIDLNDYDLPLFGVDKIPMIGIPQLALDFANKIDECDFLLVSLAENNGAYTTAFKNMYDWLSVIQGREVFGNKPMFLMATSPGERGGATVLDIARNRFIYSGAKIIDTFSLPSFNDNFNRENGTIRNATLAAELKSKTDKIGLTLSNL